MTFRADMVTYITSATGISAPVYPAGEAADATATEYITYQRFSNVHQRHQGGGAKLTMSRYQFNCWARSALRANALGELLRNRLDTFRGTMNSSSVVRGSFIEDDADDFSPPTDGSKRGRFRTINDYIFWYTEAEPSLS